MSLLCLVLLASVCVQGVQNKLFSSHVSLGRAAGVTDKAFLGFTTDWWQYNDPTFGSKWGYAGALNFDTNNTALLALVRALTSDIGARATWRVGGTPADSVIYQRRDGSWPSGSGCGGVSSPNNTNTLCLSAQRFTALCTFVKAAGGGNLDFFFGLNGKYGRNGNPATPLNTSQVGDLVDLAAKSGCPVTHFELGNEMLLEKAVVPAVYGKDLNRVASVIASLWPSPVVPSLVGVDDVLGRSTQILQTYGNTSADTLAKHTIHLYSSRAQGLDCSSSAVASVDMVVATERDIDSTVALMSQLPPLPFMCGECGSCSGGGGANASNAFASAFFYGPALGYSARRGFARHARSTLIGGDYGLLQYDGGGSSPVSVKPNPDYYLSLLWNRLMSQQSFNSSTDSPFTRAYIHCDRGGRGGLSALLLNAHSSQSSDFSFVTISTAGASVYEMRASGGRMSSRIVCLVDGNGVCNDLVFTNAQVPTLTPAPWNGKLRLQPLSYAFVSLPFANIANCA